VKFFIDFSFLREFFVHDENKNINKFGIDNGKLARWGACNR